MEPKVLAFFPPLTETFVELGLVSMVNRESDSLVQKVFCDTLNRVVAAKVARSEDSASRVNREIFILSELGHHPNVVEYLGEKLVNDLPVLLVGYACRGSMRQAWPGTTLSQRLGWILGAARGLYHLHESDIVHGNITCDNIVIDGNGHAMLVDFKSAGNEGEPLDWYTNFYMAPETFEKRRSSRAVDVYALGIVLGMCLGDHMVEPWRGLHNNEVEDKLIKGERPPLPVNASPKVCRLVGRMVDVKARRPSLIEVIAELERIVGPVPAVQAPPFGRQELVQILTTSNDAKAVGCAHLMLLHVPEMAVAGCERLIVLDPYKAVRNALGALEKHQHNVVVTVAMCRVVALFPGIGLGRDVRRVVVQAMAIHNANATAIEACCIALSECMELNLDIFPEWQNPDELDSLRQGVRAVHEAMSVHSGNPTIAAAAKHALRHIKGKMAKANVELGTT